MATDPFNPAIETSLQNAPCGAVHLREAQQNIFSTKFTEEFRLATDPFNPAIETSLQNTPCGAVQLRQAQRNTLTKTFTDWN